MWVRTEWESDKERETCVCVIKETNSIHKQINKQRKGHTHIQTPSFSHTHTHLVQANFRQISAHNKKHTHAPAQSSAIIKSLFLTAAFEPLLTRHKASSSWVHKPFTDFIESQITLSGPPEISSIIVNPQFSLTSPILQSETHKQGPHGQTHTPLGVQPCCEVWLPRAKHLKSLASGPHHCFHTCSAVVMMFNKSLVASVDPVMGISLLGQQGCHFSFYIYI